MDPIFQVERVGKSYKNAKVSEKVLHDVTFGVGQGEIVAILGPSGCGKSTLLNLLGGFERPDEGTVRFEGKQVDGPSRRCVMIFQQYGLLPWRTVRKNVEIGLERIGLTAGERRRRAEEYIERVGLSDRIDHFPHQLSGGMQQRVALARALAVRPKVLLMDEPFGAISVVAGKGKVLYQSEEIWKDSVDCGLVLRDEFIEKDRELAQSFVDAYLEAGRSAEHKGEDERAVLKKYMNVDDKVLELSLQWIAYDDLRLDEASYERLRVYLKEMGLSENPPTFEEFVDNSFIDAAAGAS